jgi:ketosteroid isomerase-like protein
MISLDDRVAIQDLLVSFSTAVDSMHDIDGILAVFDEDAVYDLSGIGMGKFEGHAGVRTFFEGTFAANSHHAHHQTNFAITGFAGDTASARTYVIGMARGKDGGGITVHARYYFDLRRTDAGWKITRHWIDFLIPPG